MSRSLIDQLLWVKPAIQAAWARAQIIDDVLNDRIKTEKTSTTLNSSELKYLPRGSMESEAEYTKRVGMTPWYPKTPQILRDRQGALFSDPPELTGDDKDEYKDFEKSATTDGESLLRCEDKVSRCMQAQGFCAIMVDRQKLPEDAKARAETISEAEVKQRGLGKQVLVMYNSTQIYDFEMGTKGLKSIKLVETSMERKSILEEPKKVITVRVIDDTTVTSYRIEQEGTEKKITGTEVASHQFKNADGSPRIPVVLASPYTGDDGIGRPQLLGCAEADVSSTQLLSDIRYLLFVYANPILTLSTDRDPDDLKKFVSGVSRYIPLKNGNGQQEPEKLEFTQLDPIGINLLITMYERFQQEVDAQAGKDAPGAITQPLNEQSGISRAWQFKTGQERVLYMITRELQEVFDQLLDIVAVDMGRDPEKIGIMFNDDFDMAAPGDNADIAIKVLPLFSVSKTATSEIKKRLINDVYPDLPNMEDIENEIDEGKDLQLDPETGNNDLATTNMNKVPKDKQNVVPKDEQVAA